LEISAEFVKHGGLVYDLAIPHYKPPWIGNLRKSNPCVSTIEFLTGVRILEVNFVMVT
jgi:hypothetical protein